MSNKNPRETSGAKDDRGKKLKKKAIRGVTTAAVLASMLAGSAFSGPADIIDDQDVVNYKPAPIVMDVDEYVNAPVEDDDDGDDFPGTEDDTFFTASLPSQVSSTSKPFISNTARAISRFTSISSARRSRLPAKDCADAHSLTPSVSGTAAPIALVRATYSSEKNIGLLQNPLTPADIASSRIVCQS